MNKRTLLFVLGLFSAIYMYAQEQDEKNIVNRIKRDTTYIYGETTLPTKDEAISVARELLVNAVMEWCSTEKSMANSENFVIKDFIDHCDTITLMRGEMFRAFIYVRKSDIVPVSNSKNVLLVEGKREDKKQENNAAKANPVLEELLKITSFDEIQPCLKRYKSEGKILQYGKYATMPDSGNRHLIVYNRNGGIEAFLKYGETCLNLKTNQEDSTRNYKGCGALWFILADNQ